MNESSRNAAERLNNLQVAVLDAVHDEPGWHAGRIGFVACLALGRTTAATSQVALPALQALERRGLVRVTYSLNLSRRHWWITPSGQAALDALRSTETGPL